MTVVEIGPHKFNRRNYDAHRDVLYLSVGEPQEAADSHLTPEGHVVRFDAEGRIIGITIINAKWLIDRGGGVRISVPVFVDGDVEAALS